jgi:sporulation protein YlmC with PRC-barrel domain
VIVSFTDLRRLTLATEDGAKVGRLVDLVVRLDTPDPRIVRMRVGRRRWVAEIETVFVRNLDVTPVVSDPARLEAPRLGDDELLLGRHVLDAQIVDLEGKRVTRVGDVTIELESLTVAGVTVGLSAVLRRLGLRRLAEHARTESVDWRDLHLTSRRGHMLLLDSPAAALHRARPDALSHLVAHLPHRHAHEVLTAVGAEKAEAVRRAPTASARRFPFRWIRRHASP